MESSKSVLAKQNKGYCEVVIDIHKTKKKIEYPCYIIFNTLCFDMKNKNIKYCGHDKTDIMVSFNKQIKLSNYFIRIKDD